MSHGRTVLSRVVLPTWAAAVLLATAAAALLSLPTVASAAVGQWPHAWEVVRLTQMRPPVGTPVFYLGDSTARESTVRDALWTLQLRRRAAALGRTTATVVFSLTTHEQTFGMDRQLIAAMPPRRPGAPRGIALIGVGLSRFSGPPTTRRQPAIRPPAQDTPPVLPWTQHIYGDRPLPLARKHQLVRQWMPRHWAGFRRNLPANLHMLDQVLALCTAKGLRPVLVQLPIDLRLVGHSFDRPRSLYLAGCRRLAQRYHAPFLLPQGRSPLPSADYWDLIHLLPPGARIWQARLSEMIARLLPAALPAP